MREIIKNKVDYLINNGDYSKLKDYVQHSNYSTFEHCVAVAEMSLTIAETFNIKVDEDELVTAALLHDYYLYDWHIADDAHKWHGFFHGKVACKNAVRHYKINKRQQEAIERHMFPMTLPPTNRLGVIITLADKVCATKEVFFRKPSYA